MVDEIAGAIACATEAYPEGDPVCMECLAATVAAAANAETKEDCLAIRFMNVGTIIDYSTEGREVLSVTRLRVRIVTRYLRWEEDARQFQR